MNVFLSMSIDLAIRGRVWRWVSIASDIYSVSVATPACVWHIRQVSNVTCHFS